MSAKGRLVLACSLISVVLLGCSKGNPNAPARLEGKVTYKGSPVTAGTIAFIAEGGGQIPYPIKSDGTYAATDLPVGELKVTIETESANPGVKKQTYGPGGNAPGGGRQSSPIPEGRGVGAAGYVKIPAKYSDQKTTDLKVTVTKGDNRKDFDLTD